MRVVLHAFVHFLGVFEIEHDWSSAHIVQQVIIEEYDTLQSAISTSWWCYKPVVFWAFKVKTDNVSFILIFEP